MITNIFDILILVFFVCNIISKCLFYFIIACLKDWIGFHVMTSFVGKWGSMCVCVLGGGGGGRGEGQAKVQSFIY